MRTRFAGVIFFSFALLVIALAVYTSARFPDPSNVTNVPTFPTNVPCTPVPDTLHPPIYPNALQVSITPHPTRQWLEVMYTTSFLTTDDPATVLNYYRTTMTADGWSSEYQLSNLMKTPGASAYGYPDSEVATMTDIIDIQGYAAFCNTTSAHPIRVAVVVRLFDAKYTQVLLRVY